MATSMASLKKPMKKKTSKRANNENGKNVFQWTDDELELLLNVTYDYKAAKAMDWESVKNKYVRGI